MTFNNDELHRYGDVLRKVFQIHGISNRQEWNEIGSDRQRPHMEAAQEVIRAFISDLESRNPDAAEITRRAYYGAW